MAWMLAWRRVSTESVDNSVYKKSVRAVSGGLAVPWLIFDQIFIFINNI